MTQPFTHIPVFYSPRMVADAQSHSPSAGKPAHVVQSWQQLGVPLSIRSFEPASREQLCLAHSPDYVDAVLEGRRKNGFGNRLPEVAQSLPYTTGAMIAAAREALDNVAVAVAPVSGFHHARFAHAAGYCTFNGLIVAARVLQAENRALKVGILDFDMHYGDGTDQIIAQLDLRDIVHYTAGNTYNREEQAEEFLHKIPAILASFVDCDVVLYQAGADPHIDDPYGGWLTDAQLMQRDWRVFQGLRRMGIPVAWNLAGGYQENLRSILDIHDATMRACARAHRLDTGKGTELPPFEEQDTSADLSSIKSKFHHVLAPIEAGGLLVEEADEELDEDGIEFLTKLPPLTPELMRTIIKLAKQPDIRSVSCAFRDFHLWYALFREQVRRSRASGLPYQDAFCLCAPDTGLEGFEIWHPDREVHEFIPPRIGGEIHISWEGVCGGDLYIVPGWRIVTPGDGPEPASLADLVHMKCNYALSHRDLGVVDCATRTIVADGWYLYTSNAPHEDCNPFRG